MNSFAPGHLGSQTISPALLTAVRQIGEFRGKEALYVDRAPQVLETLLVQQTSVAPGVP